MIRLFQNVLNFPELKKRIVFTLLLLTMVGIGSHLIIPGVDSRAILEFLQGTRGAGVLGFYDGLAGGALSHGDRIPLA